MGTGLFLIVTLGAVLAGVLAPRPVASWRGAGPQVNNEQVTGSSAARAAELPGLKAYDEACSRCHGREGRSTTAPTLVPFLWSYTQALDIVRNGGACGMPAFKESELSDDALKQIVDYLKTFN